MIQILRRHLRTAIWFVIGLTCTLLFATGFPFHQLGATAIYPNVRGSLQNTEQNKPQARYWSVGVSKDPTHQAPNFYGS